MYNSLQIFFRYGESGQILRTETLTVEPGQFTYKGLAEGAALAVSPTQAEHQLRAGERKTQIFEVENILTSPLRIEIALAEPQQAMNTLPMSGWNCVRAMNLNCRPEPRPASQ